MDYIPFGLSTYSQRDGRWFFNERECEGADSATFTPCNNLWAIDAKGVFIGGKRLQATHPAECRVLNLLYAKDSAHVYTCFGVAEAIANVDQFRVLDSGRYITDGVELWAGYARDDRFVYFHLYGLDVSIVEGADAATFERLDHGYAKDAKSIWDFGYRLEGPDVRTFEPLSRYFSRDHERVFYVDEPLPLANPADFKVIASDYGVDKERVYYGNQPIEGADPASFRVLDARDHVSRDDKRVYIYREVIPAADPESFKRLGANAGIPFHHQWPYRGDDPEFYRTFRSCSYYRDRTQVFHFNRLIEGADPDSFRAIDARRNVYRDDKRVYIFYDVVPGADPESFQCLGDRDYYRDQSRVFYQLRLVKGADPDSFRALDVSKSVWRDDKHVFVADELVSGADPETFHYLGKGDYYRDQMHVFYNHRLVAGADVDTFVAIDWSWGHDNHHFYRDGVRARR